MPAPEGSCIAWTSAFCIIRAIGVGMRSEAVLALVRLFAAFLMVAFLAVRFFSAALLAAGFLLAAFLAAVRFVAEIAANVCFASLFGVFGALGALAFGGVEKRSRKL
jgi:hypothetical protein